MPRITPDESIPVLIGSARRALSLTQGGLGGLLRVSRKTAGRWEAGRVVPAPSDIRALACAVHPHDRGLAAKLAEQAGETLSSLKLEAPPPPPPPPPAPAPAPRPPAPVALMVESVVCAAAEAQGAQPSEVRAVLLAAFQRARAMSLTVEEVDDALRPAAPRVVAGSLKARGKTGPGT
jgi:DNA-binding XRE family transcriptional regulator